LVSDYGLIATDFRQHLSTAAVAIENNTFVDNQVALAAGNVTTGSSSTTSSGTGWLDEHGPLGEWHELRSQLQSVYQSDAWHCSVRQRSVFGTSGESLIPQP
jgi:hypothetical protein